MSVVQSLHGVLFWCTQDRVDPVSECLEGKRTQRAAVRYPGLSPFPLRRGMAMRFGILSPARPRPLHLESKEG